MAGRTIARFRVDMKKAARLLDAGVGEIAKRITFGIGQGVVRRTPVDTGALANSWVAAEGEPDREPPVGIVGTGSSAESNMLGQLGSLKFDTYGLWTIGNYQPYTEVIEFESHSGQAPDGMLRLAIAEEQALFDNTIDRVMRAKGLK